MEGASVASGDAGELGSWDSFDFEMCLLWKDLVKNCLIKLDQYFGEVIFFCKIGIGILSSGFNGDL